MLQHFLPFSSSSHTSYLTLYLSYQISIFLYEARRITRFKIISIRNKNQGIIPKPVNKMKSNSRSDSLYSTLFQCLTQSIVRNKPSIHQTTEILSQTKHFQPSPLLRHYQMKMFSLNSSREMLQFTLILSFIWSTRS